MIHIYSTTSLSTGFIIYHAQDYEAGWCSAITRDLTSLRLDYKSTPNASNWTLIGIVPSLPIDLSQYPELLV